MTTPPKPVTIGGLSGLVTDVHLPQAGPTNASSRADCRPSPFWSALRGPRSPTAWGPGRTAKFYLLSFEGRTLAIEVPDFSMGKHLAEYDRVVKPSASARDNDR